MHPLDSFKYCSQCGSRNFNIIAPNAKKCADCGFEQFKSPTMGACAVVFDSKDRLLCIRRAKEPGKGLLGVPAGFVDLGETIEEAAIRETKEETGIDIEITGFLGNFPNSYIYNGIEQYPLDFYLRAIIKDDSQIKVQEGETTEVLFIPRDEININDFAFESTRILLRQLVKI